MVLAPRVWLSSCPNIPIKSGAYHEVKMIPNQELANNGESEKPLMVKSLKEMLVGSADIGGHPNIEPVMNDGKFQTISHMKNSINHNRDEKIHNWDKSHQSNRFIPQEEPLEAGSQASPVTI